jgi:16S rRNA (uracil1498-N3)-methyltransferase
MANHRLYVDAVPRPGELSTLDPERSHYLCRVLRQRRGDHVILFAGDGAAYDAQIETSDAHACEVSVGECIERQPAPRLRLHLCQALIKGDKLDWVLQKATELGVTDIWLLQTQRTEVHVEGARVSRRERHWRRVIDSAAEQCGRLHLPQLHGPIALDRLLTAPPAEQVFILDPGAPPLTRVPPELDTALLVGPEGGFTDAERTAAIARGATAVGLGAWTLRADTATVVAITMLRHSWNWNAP